MKNDRHFFIHSPVECKNGSVVILEDINLSIKQFEQWAIIGGSGSGKTALAHTLMGRLFHSGEIEFFMAGEKKIPRIGMVEQQHRFKNLLPNTTDLYYQQRFNASDANQTITMEQELASHLPEEEIPALEWLRYFAFASFIEEAINPTFKRGK